MHNNNEIMDRIIVEMIDEIIYDPDIYLDGDNESIEVLKKIVDKYKKKYCDELYNSSERH